jgi:uncharacterized protein YcbX
VASLYRYPVKSLTGERLAAVTVQSRGLEGDRLWAVRDADGKLGSGKSTRRFRRMDGLLELRAGYTGDVPVIAFPDGSRLPATDPRAGTRLSDHVGRPVTLHTEQQVSHFDEGPVHLVTRASLAALGRARGSTVDERRTRANVVVDIGGEGFPEHGWVGRRVQLGSEVVLRVEDVMPRCVMLTCPQDDLDADPSLLRDLAALTEGALGVVATVERGGSLRVGDPVRPARLPG